jgi:monooxygenase
VRLLRHMDRHGYASCTPRNRDHTLASEPFIKLSSSSSFQRSVQQFPHQGASARGGFIRTICWTSSRCAWA